MLCHYDMYIKVESLTVISGLKQRIHNGLSMITVIMEMQHVCRNVSILHTYLSMRYATLSRYLFSQNSVGHIWFFYTIFFICRCRIFLKIRIVILLTILTLFDKNKNQQKTVYIYVNTQTSDAHFHLRPLDSFKDTDGKGEKKHHLC